MTVELLIALLKVLPQQYEVCVDRGGAYDEAKSVEQNDELEAVFISSEEDL